MQQLAHNPSQQVWPSNGLVSLLDMINFEFFDAYRHLKLLTRQFNVAEGATRTTAADMADVCTALSVLQDASKLWGELRLEAIKSSILTALQGILKGGITNDGMARTLDAVIDKLECELRQEKFYRYPRAKAALVETIKLDWAKTLQAFRSATGDITSAVDCYALGHNRASIYHSMMVLEFGLPALATRLKVGFNPDKATWADLTKGIRDKIADERTALANNPKGKPPPARAAAKRKNEFLEACEEAATEFRYFTTVWRNHIAHGRGDYDENDAKKVLEHVRTFMEVISIKLQLKEKP